MGDRRRRKSLTIFKPSGSGLTPIEDRPPDSAPVRAGVLRKKIRPSSLFSSTPPITSSSPLHRKDSDASSKEPASPILKVRPASRSSRPSSLFGSLRSIQSIQSTPDVDSFLERVGSNNSASNVDGTIYFDGDKLEVLHHGEVQIGVGMFRRKNQYFVLTSSHLLRFKNETKALEAFPALGQSGQDWSEKDAHCRNTSSGSLPENQISSEELAKVAVKDIVAVYKLDDGRPYFTVEIAHLDAVTNTPSTLSLQLSDPTDSETWLATLRGAVIQGRQIGGLPFTRRTVEYVARTLEHEGDYDPNHFQMYCAIQRASKLGGRSSSDDLGKLQSNLCYLVIGYYKIHLVPLIRHTKSASSTSISDLSGASHGVTTLSAVKFSEQDDSFQLSFRVPMSPPLSLHLASSCIKDIALSLKQASEFLRPLWMDQPYSWLNAPSPSVPPSIIPAEDDYGAFDRTLTAYCTGYKVDPSNIRYTINNQCEDAPEFQLLAPDNARRPNYNSLELLAILRALRYNESFRSISFKGCKLDALHQILDRFGSEHISYSTRQGQMLDRPQCENLSLLVQELQNVAVQNEALRRLDFSDCLSHRASDIDYMQKGGTEICEAILPLCTQNLTNVNSLDLSGLALSELDVNCLYSATLNNNTRFRAIDMARCSLTYDGLRIISEGMQSQAGNIESINISSCAARLSPDFIDKMSGFSNLRYLDLSNVQIITTPTAFLSYHCLINWKLEVLRLSGTPLNTESIDDLAGYVMGDQSGSLRELYLDSCQLNDEEIAVLLHSIASSDGGAVRDMLLDVSYNRSQEGHKNIVSAVERSATPTRLIVRSLEYTREEDFRSLVIAIARNTSLRHLDISRVSLPFDASSTTCAELGAMFEANNTLQVLNISGETAHLEAATLGKGLFNALKGLSVNKSLRVLYIQNQLLGLPGASALADVLEENDTLEELHCEDNEINLQAFTIMINAVKNNKTLLWLPPMTGDRSWSHGKVSREVSNILAAVNGSDKAQGSTASNIKSSMSLRRTFTSSSNRPHSNRTSSTRSTSSRSSNNSAGSPLTMSTSYTGGFNAHKGDSNSTFSTGVGGIGFTEQDVTAAIARLDDSWDKEVARLQSYLERNAYLAQGMTPPGTSTGHLSTLADVDSVTEAVEDTDLSESNEREDNWELPAIPEGSRPGTRGSWGLTTTLMKAGLDRTPTAEVDRQLIVDTSAAEGNDLSAVSRGSTPLGEESGDELVMGRGSVGALGK